MGRKHKTNQTVIPEHVDQQSGTVQVTMQNVYIQEHLFKENMELKIQLGNMTGQKEQLERLLSERDKTIEELKKENEELRSKIKVLEEKNVILESKVTKLELDNTELKKENIELKHEIVELKKENIELKHEIVELKKENVELKKEIVELKHEIVELKKENIELKKENVELKKEIVELKDIIGEMQLERYIDKVIVAIQDVNSYDSLETKIDHNFQKELFDLRSNRIDTCHYILTKQPRVDSLELINYKKKMLLAILDDKKFANVSNEIDLDYKSGFINAFKNILNNVINPNLQEPAENEKRKVLRFWK